MGHKSGWTWKCILHYLAISCIIGAVNFVACAPVQDKTEAMTTHQLEEKTEAMTTHQQLEEYRENLAAGFFETVIQQSKQVLAENETEPPADVALYSLGEVYAHYDYEGRDYVLSQYYFEKLIESFPDSKLTSEAKTYISLFETIAAKEKMATVKQKSVSVTKHKKVVENQNFEEAVEKNLQILDKTGEKKPADEALYNLGLIYAHINNPAKDYKKSQIYFQALVQQFPDSELAEEGQIWLGLFETIEKIQQIDIDIEQQKKQIIR
jgi:TolA-binding protein